MGCLWVVVVVAVEYCGFEFSVEATVFVTMFWKFPGAKGPLAYVVPLLFSCGGLRIMHTSRTTDTSLEGSATHLRYNGSIAVLHEGR